VLEVVVNSEIIILLQIEAERKPAKKDEQVSLQNT
jgi:hypothetical protein